MDIETVANNLAAEAKILADDIKSAATGPIATEVVSYLPSLAPFLKLLAADAGLASGALALVPVAETLIRIAKQYGVKSATVDQQIFYHQDSNPGG